MSHSVASPERAASVAGLLRAARAMLDTDDAHIDSELLLAHVLQRPRSYLFAHPEAAVAPLQCGIYRALVARRLRRPVQVVEQLAFVEEFGLRRVQVLGARVAERPFDDGERTADEVEAERVEQLAADDRRR